MADLKISQLTGATTPLAGTEVLPIVQSSTTKKVSTDDLTVKNVRSNATSGILQVAGPGAGTTHIMTTPNANFTVARTDAGQTFTGAQTINGAYDSNNPSTSSVPILKVNEGGALSIWASAKAYNYTWMQSIQDDGSNNLKPLFLQPLGGDVWLGGNIAQLVANKGFDFASNTPAAGMTSQLLNWYEEGTWTPVVRGAATAGTYELATASGQYVRVGNQVTIWCRIVAAAVVTGGGAGYLQITGAPFANANSTAGTVYGAGLDMTNGYTWLVAAPIAGSGTTIWYLEECGDGQNASDFPISGFGVNDTIKFCATYRV